MARTKGTRVVIIVTDKVTGVKTAYTSIPKAVKANKLDLGKVRYAMDHYGIFETKNVEVEMILYYNQNV